MSAKPQPNPIVDKPATVADCQQDRQDASTGKADAVVQLGAARSHGNESAGSR